MNFFAALAVLSSSFYFVIGILTFSKDPRQRANLLFLLLSAFTGTWSFGLYLFFMAETAEKARQIVILFSGVVFACPPLFLHFYLVLTGILCRFSKKLVPLFYLPFAIIAAATYAGHGFIGSVYPIYIKSVFVSWSVEYGKGSLLFWLFTVASLLEVLGCVCMLISWHRNSPAKRGKRQARVIMLTLFPSIILSGITGIVLPMFRVGKLPPLVPIIMTVWIWGMGYAINRYRLLTITPADAAEKILSRISDMVLLISPDGRIVSSNQRFREITGYTERFLKGTDPSPLFSAPLPAIGNEDSPSIEMALRTQAGGEIPVISTYSGITDSDGDFIGSVVAMQDARIMKRLEAENRERLEAEEKFSKAFMHSPIGIAITDLSGDHIIDANEALAGMIGFPRRELVDAFVPGIGIWENDEHRDETMRRIIAQGPFKGIEVEYPRRDGSRVTLLISAETIEIHGEPRVLFSVVDMTELKHLETENLKVKKLESIATLSGGIAHDFNNILTAVMGNLSLATLSCSQDQELRTTIDNAYSACLRAKDLTWKLLVFSRGGLPEKKRVSLREVIAEAESLSLRGSQTEGNAISCVTRFADDELIVSGDRALLIQVFHNLFINAVHAMPNGGSITVIERIMSAADIPARGYPDTINPGTYCSISITDTGSGIPKPVIANIFDPYYSTKPNGTGLGLSIVYSIVKNHGGHIAVDSDEGKGTTFRILLPLAEPDTVSH